ncbi:MAG TPA: glutathione S-transferase [Gammaproteobacteria bacterium]|nr:glutathione S-transferase [Gammaproteobacteria bacterium]
MIEFYRFGPAWGLPDPSPFVLKLELWLKMAGIEYQDVVDGDTRKAPKNKLPYIKLDGEAIGDSELIIDALKQRFGDTVDNDLSAEQEATSHLLIRLMHDSFYWALLHCRWMEENGWNQVRPALFGDLPAPLRLIVPPLVRRSLRKALAGQGFGRHNREEKMAMAKRDIDSLEILLGDQPFFLGDQPHTVDATVQAFLISFLGPPIDNPVKQYLLSKPKLLDYYQRMNQRFYPHLPQPG